MAIPAALQAKLDEYEKEEQSAQSQQQATDETDSTSFVGDDHVQDDAPNDDIAHDDDAMIDTGKGVAQDEKTHTQSSDADQNFKRMEGRYKAQIKRLEEELAQAKLSNQGNQLLINEITSLKQEISQLKAGNGVGDSTSAEANNSNGSIDDDFDFEIPSEVEESYGDIKPALKSLAKPLLARIRELEAQQGKVKETFANKEEGEFIARVQAEVPNFSEATQNNAQWQAFLNQEIPFTGGLTMKDALAKAHSSRDLNTIKGIFAQFGSSQNANFHKSTANVSAPQKGLAEFATPDKNAVNQKVGKKYTFRQSDYARKTAEMKAGLISKEEFLAFDEAFDKAKSSGLVADN